MWFSVHNVVIFCAFLFGAVIQASTFSPARPPAIPLAVRSPYLNTYLFAGAGTPNSGNLPGQWPRFWDGQVTGWTGIIRVDGRPYIWMGDPSGAPLATQTSFEYTSTKSIFTMTVEKKIGLKITFLSPVTLDDLKRQSLVFSYLNVEVHSLDGKPHDVQLYTDISAGNPAIEWVSGDRSAFAEWDYAITDNIAHHRVHRQTELLFSERWDQSEWGNWYYATNNVTGLTHQSGPDKLVRETFLKTGRLHSVKDTKFRRIVDDWPVFGFAIDLGVVTREPIETLFTIGLAQELAIQFLGKDGVKPLPSLWKSYFDSEAAALTFFHNDFSNATATSTALDAKIAQDSLAAGGPVYNTITSLSTRQAIGATQLVGTASKPYLFIKEISSDGNVGTVDVIFPFHPFLLYLSPNLMKLMLDPLFENQETKGNYPNKWSIHDIGASYPNATGHKDGNDEPMPLEECGNMLIMVLAYAQRTGDVQYLKQHYKLLAQWTEFLIDEALVPAEQISTDDFAGRLVNQTNLALKGIIGIEAMSQIALLTDSPKQSSHYHSIAKNYITQWITLSTTPFPIPHTTLSYSHPESHGLLYNLYADALLSLDLVPKSVYRMQSDFYPLVMEKYGVPLDTRLRGTKSDWLMFCAAVAEEGTKTMLVEGLGRWIGETRTERAMTDLWDVGSGDYAVARFVARPVVGGHFALLALPNRVEESIMKEEGEQSEENGQTKLELKRRFGGKL